MPPVQDLKTEYVITRKFPLPRYILGMLMHTTAWDQHWGGDEILKLVLAHVVSLVWLPLTYQYNLRTLASPHLKDPRESEGDRDFKFFTLPTYQATFVISMYSFWLKETDFKKG